MLLKWTRVNKQCDSHHSEIHHLSLTVLSFRAACPKLHVCHSGQRRRFWLLTAALKHHKTYVNMTLYRKTWFHWTTNYWTSEQKISMRLHLSNHVLVLCYQILKINSHLFSFHILKSEAALIHQISLVHFAEQRPYVINSSLKHLSIWAVITYCRDNSHSESMTQWSLNSSGHYHRVNNQPATAKTQSCCWHNGKFMCIRSDDRKGTVTA